MQEILGFIAQRRSIGQTDQFISEELLRAGWDPQTVSRGFQQSPPSSVPFETISAPHLPEQSFYPQVNQQQPQSYQQAVQPVNPVQINPIQPQPQSQSAAFQPGPQPRQGSNKLKFVLVGLMVIILLLVGVGGFLFFNSDSTTETVENTADPAASIQRDTLRRGDINRLFAEAETQSDLNQGRYPEANRAGWETLISNFRDFKDPATDTEYEFTTASPIEGQIQYANRVICNEDTLAVGTQRSIVIRVLLETGEIYCVDNT